MKGIIKNCVHCKRFNGRTIKISQNDYRDFRLSPNNTPFSTVAIDYAGPYRVRQNSEVLKVYVLVITCLFTRAVNLKVSINMSTSEFLRSFQMHIHEFGLAQFVLSDMGSNIVSGANLIKDFLSEPETILYLNENGSKLIEFNQYVKGRHELGSLVESCVKLTKRLLSGSLKKNLVSTREFEFFVSHATHLVNRRPIAFRDSLRDAKEILPEIITPELLLHGFHLPSVNVIPSLHLNNGDDSIADPDFDAIGNIKQTEKKLKIIRQNLVNIYNNEFLPQLIAQATNSNCRYKPVSHDKLAVGDVVLMKEENMKQVNYPMGRIKSVTSNELGEVTSAVVYKGATGEHVKRHSSVLIPLLHERSADGNHGNVTEGNSVPHASSVTEAVRRRSSRAAARDSMRRTRAILADS